MGTRARLMISLLLEPRIHCVYLILSDVPPQDILLKMLDPNLSERYQENQKPILKHPLGIIWSKRRKYH
jgi:hypothetical protein